jgi:hypothetical protein
VSGKLGVWERPEGKLVGAQAVGSHELNCLPAQDAHSFQLPAVRQHLREALVIQGCGEQVPTAAG